MPSQILETLTTDRLAYYDWLLGAKAYACATCTLPIAEGDLVEPLGGDPIKSLNCGECAIQNYQSRVSHIETALQYARGELQAVTEEVAEQRRRKRKAAENRAEVVAFDQHGYPVGPLVVLDLTGEQLNANERALVMRSNWFRPRGAAGPILVLASEIGMTTTAPESLGIDVARGVDRLGLGLGRECSADGFTYTG